jgi:NAD(P)H-flavin reductase
MLIRGIKSKPVYTPLAPDLGGRTHLLVGFGVGAEPLTRLMADCTLAGVTKASRRLLYVTDKSASMAMHEMMRHADAGEVQLFKDSASLLSEFETILKASIMGTRLYVAGPEAFMGLVMRIAARFNLNRDEIRAEECGSPARRVHCIHCRAATEDVTTNIVQCVDCQRWLVVRDHYSRRLAAYMGVMIDAEVPGELPPIEEVFV